MYLFIFESIGTSELLMIGAVALIVFGPRKLPQMAKTFGKAMAEFKNTTNEFKSTWEREVNFEEKNISQTPINLGHEKENKLFEEKSKEIAGNELTPEIKEVDASRFKVKDLNFNQTPESVADNPQTEKQYWL